MLGRVQIVNTCQIEGHMLPHLVGNCQQDFESSSEVNNDLWLQMGAEHCIRINRLVKKSWIKAEQKCKQTAEKDGNHLIAVHNELDEKLVQNLVFNR